MRRRFPQKLQLKLQNFLHWLKLMLRQSCRPVAAEEDTGWEIGMGSWEGSKDFEESPGWGLDTQPGSLGCLGRWVAGRCLDLQEALADSVGWRQDSGTLFDSLAVWHLAVRGAQV